MEDINLDLNTDPTENLVPVEPKEVKKKSTKKAKQEAQEDGPTVNCLRNERIIVRRVPKTQGIWGNNPKHVLSGGMAEGAIRGFEVPRLTSGSFVNVLTDDEKTFLEEVLGLEYNALSVYKKGEDNFWDNRNPDGISQVYLTKEDNYFDLSDPRQYIQYKILLANKNIVAPSLQALEDMPKASYQFVVIREGDEARKTNKSMNILMECYKLFGKIEDDFDTLKTVVEIIDGRPVSKDTKIEFLKAKANTLIQSDLKLFYKIISDPLLPTKVLLKKAIEAAIISNRGGMLYLRKDNTPLCGHNEEPTLNTAARFLNLPANQEIKFSIEAQLK